MEKLFREILRKKYIITPSTQFAAEFIGDINKIRIKVKKDGEILTTFLAW